MGSTSSSKLWKFNGDQKSIDFLLLFRSFDDVLKTSPPFQSLTHVYCSTVLALDVMFNECRCELRGRRRMRACWACVHRATNIASTFNKMPTHLILSVRCVLSSHNCFKMSCHFSNFTIFHFSFSDAPTWVRIQEATVGWTSQLSREFEGSRCEQNTIAEQRWVIKLILLMINDSSMSIYTYAIEDVVSVVIIALWFKLIILIKSWWNFVMLLYSCSTPADGFHFVRDPSQSHL